MAVRICPAPGTWPAAPAGHRSEAREATPVVRWLQVPVQGASPEATRCPAAAGGSAPVRDGQLGALFGQVACGDRVAFEAAYCRTAGQVPGVGVFRAAWRRKGLGRAAAAMLSGLRSRASRLRRPRRPALAAASTGTAGRSAVYRGAGGFTRRYAGQARRSAALPAGVSTAKAGPPVRRASLSTTGLTGPAEHRRRPSSLISSPRPGAACCWSPRTAASKSASKPCSSHDHSPACLATAPPARRCQAPRPVLQQTLSEPAASSAATVANRAAQGAE